MGFMQFCTTAHLRNFVFWFEWVPVPMKPKVLPLELRFFRAVTGGAAWLVEGLGLFRFIFLSSILPKSNIQILKANLRGLISNAHYGKTRLLGISWTRRIYMSISKFTQGLFYLVYTSTPTLRLVTFQITI